MRPRPGILDHGGASTRHVLAPRLEHEALPMPRKDESALREHTALVQRHSGRGDGLADASRRMSSEHA